uniref:Glutamate-rich protein 2 n=1 Tax=Eptatretus burgeri TaxID=7764 RepID=A0A8C4WWQ9_EPTBU
MSQEDQDTQLSDNAARCDIQNKAGIFRASHKDKKENDRREEGDEETQCASLTVLTEFLGAVMNEDYELAKKLCQTILIYEPQNVTALQFQPLLDKRIIQVQEQKGAEENQKDSGDEEGEDETESSSDE